jgi:hypothetical protein
MRVLGFYRAGFAAEILVVRFLLPIWTVQFRQAGIEFYAIGFSRLTPLGWFGSSRKSGGWF